MSAQPWQLVTPIDAVVFDCDGTLSALEGIDTLAKANRVATAVKRLTTQAMGQSGLTAEIYRHRLALVRPTQLQVTALGAAYAVHMQADTLAIICLLQKLNKRVFIVSAGLYPAVAIFAEHLNIPLAQVFAVGINFNSQGRFVDFETTSPLINNDGKYYVVQAIQQHYPRIVHIGDGLNDYVTHALVTRFIGYGGIFYRGKLARLCTHYITTTSLAAILPLCLTQMEYHSLTATDKILFDRGVMVGSNQKNSGMSLPHS